jgi:CheY-like chemotaxis protein/nitrogen-specific signal transduction histidine kinase
LPVRDNTGKIIHWFGTCTDIHDQKMAEDALREAARRKDDFLAMLAHELRNPLAPIKNAVQMLALLAPDDPRLVRAREIIDRQTNHLTRMVDDLLDVSRVTRGKIDLKREPVRLQSVVDRAVEMAQPLIRERGHTFSSTPVDDELHVEGDFDRLVQVLSNLLVNAAKFTPPGGQIHLSTENAGIEARITVRDNGIGLTPAQCDRIFDIFAQEDQSLARSQGGLGIGLTLVKRLVEMHGGHISAHSPGVGQGSEFVIDLPTIASRAATALPVNEAVNPLSSLRILVVEDNPDSAASLMALFEVCGHVVRVAPDAFAALEIVETFSPSIAFIDIGLPGLDGYELGERLREHPHCRDTVLVALTGYGRPEDKQRSWQTGFHHHLTKPVQFATINSLLAEASSAHRH